MTASVPAPTEPAEEVVVRMSRGVIGYAGAWTLGPIDLEIRRGSFWGIIGPNGSGKSTLLRALVGLTPLLSGTVSIAPSVKKGGGISYVPQREALDPVFPVTTVAVVKMGLATARGFGRPFLPRHERMALEALERVGLRHLAQVPFRQLSGGEQQRALLARATVSAPALMLLDEPTAAMDIDAERAVMSLVRELAVAHRLAVLMVSHTLPAVRKYADRVVLLDREHGQVQIGSPTELLADEILSGATAFRPRPAAEPS